MSRTYLIIPVLILYSSTSFAQEDCGYQDYESDERPDFDCVSPGEEFMVPDLQPPPSIPVMPEDTVEIEWPGAVVHKDRLIQLGLRVRALRSLRWAENLRLRRESNIMLEYTEEITRAQVELLEQQRAMYQEQLQLATEQLDRQNSWWRSPFLWFSVGVAVTGALVALSVWGISEAGQ